MREGPVRGEEQDDGQKCVEKRKENGRGEWEKGGSFVLSGVRSSVGPPSASTAVNQFIKEKFNLCSSLCELYISYIK